jgi:hypothetical protein
VLKAEYGGFELPSVVIFVFFQLNKNEAETICKIFSQCFQLLYIERTMSLLDQVIKDETISTIGSSVSVGKTAIFFLLLTINFYTQFNKFSAYERAAHFNQTPSLNKKANINQ